MVSHYKIYYEFLTLCHINTDKNSEFLLINKNTMHSLFTTCLESFDLFVNLIDFVLKVFLTNYIFRSLRHMLTSINKLHQMNTQLAWKTYVLNEPHELLLISYYRTS